MNRFLHTNVTHLYRSLIALASIMFLPMMAMGQIVEINTGVNQIQVNLLDQGYKPENITHLKVTGIIDARDFRYIRNNISNLEELDLSGITKIENYAGYEGTYTYPGLTSGMGTDRDGYHSYPLFELPTQAFSRWVNGRVTGWDDPLPKLKKVILPSCIKTIGDYAFYVSRGIETISIGEDNLYFKTIDGVLYTKDRKTLLQYPLGRKGDFTLPASVTKIESKGTNNASFTNLTLQTATPPELTSSSFNATTVWVPKGSLATYQAHGYWRRYNLKENNGEGGEDPNPTVSVSQNYFNGCYMTTRGTLSYISVKVTPLDAPIKIGIKLKDPTKWKDKLNIEFSNNTSGLTSDFTFHPLTFDEKGIAWVDYEYIKNIEYGHVGGSFQFSPAMLGTLEWDLVVYSTDKKTCYLTSSCKSYIVNPIDISVSEIKGKKGEEIPFTVNIKDFGDFKVGQQVRMRLEAYNIDRNTEIKHNGKTISSNYFDNPPRRWYYINTTLTTEPYHFTFKSNNVDEKKAFLNITFVELTGAGDVVFPNTASTKIHLENETESKEFKINELKYRILNNNTVSLIGLNTEYGPNWNGTTCTIPTTVTYDGKMYHVTEIARSFSGFDRLKEIHIPASVTKIQLSDEMNNGALTGNELLEKITVDAGNTAYTSENGILYDKNKTTLIVCPAQYKAETLTLPIGLKRIESEAFMYCVNIRDLVLPEGLTHVMGGAFAAGSTDPAWESITFPSTIQFLGDMLFDDADRGLNIYCRNTNPVNITLEDRPFVDVDTASILYVPKGCKAKYQAAEGWKEFKQIIEEDESEPSLSFTVGQLKYTVIGKNEVAISGVTDKTPAYYDIKQTVTYQDNVYKVTTVGKEAFKECTNLVRFNPESIRMVIDSIGEKAFAGCSKLSNLIFSEGLETIGDYAFSGCTGLKSLTLPASMKRIGLGIVDHCEETLEEIHSQSAAPIHLGDYPGYAFFYYSDKSDICKLYVPRGSKGVYSKAPGWKDFKYILEEGENPPLIPDSKDDEITLNTDSTYTDAEGNTGHFNGMIGNGEEETVIHKLTIKGSATSTINTITFNQVKIGNGNSTSETATSVTKSTNVVIELIGDNSLGKFVNDGIAKLLNKMEAALNNTVVINNGTFVDETGLLTRVEGTARLNITAPSDQEVSPGKNATLTASTNVSATYTVTFIWEQLQPDGTWKAVGLPHVYTPARSGLRNATTVTDRQTIHSKDAGKYRCVIRNQVGDVSSTLTTPPVTVTTKGSVDILSPKKSRKVTVCGNLLHFEISAPLKVNIINLQGTILRKLSLPAGNSYIDINGKGIYILQFEDGATEKVCI